MPFGLSEKTYSLISEVIASFEEINETILFGSRAMGNYKTGSDIDLALKGKDGQLSVSTLIRLHRRLDELPTLYRFDLVNYHTIQTPELTNHICTHGVNWFSRSNAKNNTPNPLPSL